MEELKKDEVKNFDSAIPLPPLFKPNDDGSENNDDTPIQKKRKSGQNSRFTLFSKRNLSQSNGEFDQDYSTKFEEFGGTK